MPRPSSLPHYPAWKIATFIAVLLWIGTGLTIIAPQGQGATGWMLASVFVIPVAASVLAFVLWVRRPR